MSRKTVHYIICDRCGKQDILTDVTTPISNIYGWKEMYISEILTNTIPDKKEVCSECVSLIIGTGNNKQRK